MYASQTKRLCVRGVSSDDNQANSNASSSSSSSNTIQLQTSHTTDTTVAPSARFSPSAEQQPQLVSLIAVGSTFTTDNINMTASTGITSEADNGSNVKNPMTATAGSPYRHHEHCQQPAIQNAASNVKHIPIPSYTEPSNDDAQYEAEHTGDNSPDSVENNLLTRLARADGDSEQLDCIASIRNLITACNKRKKSVVLHPDFKKIVGLLDSDNQRATINVKTQIALLLCCIARSDEHVVNIMLEHQVDRKILYLLMHCKDDNLIEACLRCIRSMTSWPSNLPSSLLYDLHNCSNQRKNNDISSSVYTQSQDDIQQDLREIVSIASTSRSFIIQECIADIFAASCNDMRDQAMLFKSGSIPCIIKLLESASMRVVLAAMNWLTKMCLKNHSISLVISNASCISGERLTDRLITMMSKENCLEMQFIAARCYAHLYRALTTDNLKKDFRIVSHVIPTLVRMVHDDKPVHLRVKSAECIAYLIESDTVLQNTASVCDHLIKSLVDMLNEQDKIHNNNTINFKNCAHTRYRCSRSQHRGVSWLNIAPDSRVVEQQVPQNFDLDAPVLSLEEACNVAESVGRSYEANGINGSHGEIADECNQEMKRAAFLALASLASNLEIIRKRIFSNFSVKGHLIKGLSSSDPRTLKAVLTCLLSLSRSVQQLRTSFADNSVHTALKNLLSTQSNEIMILVLAILCNISLDFSPGKQHFLDTKTIDLICNLCKKSDPKLRLHGMWTLMNMVYQLGDQNLKFQILQSLDVEHVMNLLEIKDDDEMIMKTLGFLRNLLSQRSHIDALMSTYGDSIVPALNRILQENYSNRIKEQCVCVLTNIAIGRDSKFLIMKNKSILSYLAHAMCDEELGDVRLASICCITNLALKEHDRAFENRIKLNKYGVESKLKSMLDISDPVLSDRVRTAYNQFIICGDDKNVATVES